MAFARLRVKASKLKSKHNGINLVEADDMGDSSDSGI